VKPFIAADAHVTDMRDREVTVDESLYYAEPARQVSTTRFGTMIQRPMEWFLRDLAYLAKATHSDLMLCWIRDALLFSSGAAETQLFTGADYWRGEWTVARAHLIAWHGYRYATWGFVVEPTPQWKLVGAHRIQVLDRDYQRLIDDNGYAVDERTVR
jgi:hypothetical protein